MSDGLERKKDKRNQKVDVSGSSREDYVVMCVVWERKRKKTGYEKFAIPQSKKHKNFFCSKAIIFVPDKIVAKNVILLQFTAAFGRGASGAWYLYKMVAQNMLRTHKEI